MDVTTALVRSNFDCPVWYRKHFIKVSQPNKFCADYWNIANRYRTYREALEGRGMRWALYTVYVVQRCKKTRWVEIECVLKDYSFPRKLYCNYLYLLWYTGRLSRIAFESGVMAVGETLGAVEHPVTEHWTEQFKKELKVLEGS